MRVAQRHPWVGLSAVFVIFLFLTILHSLIVPITQGEDELAHYRYIKFIAQTGRLPLNDEERQQAWYRADWPPLYHLLAGWVVSPLDTTRPQLKDVGESPHRRLVGEIFYPRLIIYTADASWPWQDGILAWHIGRFISILFATGALGFTYLTALELSRGARDQGSRGARDQGSRGTGEQRGGGTRKQSSNLQSPNLQSPIFNLQSLNPATGTQAQVKRLPISPQLFALAVTALLAFTPRFIFTSAMLGDDSLFILLSAIFIWLLLRALRGDDRWWVYAVMGLLLGLSIATKYSTGLLPLIIIPVAWWRARQMQWRWWQWLGRVAVSWGAMLLGASWWFGWIGYYFNSIEKDGPILGLLSGILNTGPDVSMRRIFALFTGEPFSGLARPEAIEAGTFGEWWVYLFQTFWGVPVLEHDPLFPWAYFVVLGFCLLAGVGLWQLWRVSGSQARMTLTVLLLIIGLLLPFPILRFFLTGNILETGQGRHILYPAAQSIPLLLMLGWLVISNRLLVIGNHGSRVTHHASRFTSFALRLRACGGVYYALLPPLILLTWSIFQLSYMAATYPKPLPVQTTTFGSQSISEPLEQTIAEAIQMRGHDLQPDPAQPGVYNLTIFWESLKPVDENYRVEVQVVDPQGKTSFTWLSHPLDGDYPTRAWDKGDVIQDTLPLPLTTLPPGDYDIRLNLLREAEDVALLDESLHVARLNLSNSQPLAEGSALGDYNYRLWVGESPARQRQTLPLVWTMAAGVRSDRPEWALVGPNGVPRQPLVANDHSAIFMVGADWPSGDYRLQLATDGLETEPLFTVANEARLFELPDVPETYIPVEANFANQVELLGYILPTRRAEPGSGLPLTLYWQALVPVMDDLVTFAVLLDAHQQPYSSVDRYPSGFYSPMLWVDREIVLDSFTMPVRTDAPPGVYYLHLGQYKLVDGQPRALALVQEGQLTDMTAVIIGPLKVGGPPEGVTITEPQPQVTLNQTFGQQITLIGYDLADQNGEPPHNIGEEAEATFVNAQNLRLTLYWRADTALHTDYTTFTHLRNHNSTNVSQKDSPPAEGRYPTSLWDEGEIVVDQIVIPLDGLPPGVYTPVVGLYEFASGNRLTTPGLPANEVALAPIRLAE